MKEKRTSIVMVVAMMVLCLDLAACATTPMPPAKKSDQQDEARDMAKMTLAQLYAKNPAAQGAVTGAVGYAVFTTSALSSCPRAGPRARE